MEKKVKKWTKDLVVITIGSMIYAFAINYFYVGNKLAEGGVAGISLMLHYLFDFNVGRTYMILNIPLVIIGFKMLGRDFIIKTMYSIGVVSLMLDYTTKYSTSLEDLMLAALFGGMLCGIGLGLIFVSGGSTGGIDIIARIMTKYRGIPVGKALLLIDLIVLMLVAFLFGKVIFMYTLIAVIVASKVIDAVEEGKHHAKAVTIISKKESEITAEIMESLGRGVTLLSGKGAYTEEKRDVIYCIISRYEIIKLKNIVRDIDPDAFLIVSDVAEVLGDGFKALNEKH